MLTAPITLVAGTLLMVAVGLLLFCMQTRKGPFREREIAHAVEAGDSTDDEPETEPSTLAKLTNKWDTAEKGSASKNVSSAKPKVSYRTKGRPIKVFLEIDSAVHILRVSMAPIESVDDLHNALTLACEESNAPELRDLDFKMDAQLELQYLNEEDVACAVLDDTPIGLLKCAKAMRAWRK